MNILTHDVLSESKSARTQSMQGRSNEQALEALNKAKAIVMATWKGEGWATTEQVADFYEVPHNTIVQLLTRNRSEFSLEVRKLTGKELRDVNDNVSFTSNVKQVFCFSSKTPNLNLWSPRATLRVGLMLTQSEVAKAVRDVVLNIVDAVPQLVQPQKPQLSLPEVHAKIDYSRNHVDYWTSKGNIRMAAKWEAVIANDMDVYLLPQVDIQPTVNGQPVATTGNIQYEGAVDVAIRIGFQVPSNYESALGRHVSKNAPDLKVTINGDEVKDYRSSATSNKMIPAQMYPAFNPTVENLVSEYCSSKNFNRN